MRSEAPDGQATGMRARVGDRLIVDGDQNRIGVVIAVPHRDGSPPYVIKWLANGHIAMVSPDQYTVISPAEGPAGSGQRRPAAP